jgi:hypothetical protein
MSYAVYIAEVAIKLTPIKKGSRLLPSSKHYERFPVVMNEKLEVHHKSFMESVTRMYKGSGKDMTKYNVTYKINNPKFSTKCNWN